LPSAQRDPPMSVRVRVPACNAHFLKCRRRRPPAAAQPTAAERRLADLAAAGRPRLWQDPQRCGVCSRPARPDPDLPSAPAGTGRAAQTHGERVPCRRVVLNEAPDQGFGWLVAKDQAVGRAIEERGQIRREALGTRSISRSCSNSPPPAIGMGCANTRSPAATATRRWSRGTART
jgi:hypothetical protein